MSHGFTLALKNRLSELDVLADAVEDFGAARELSRKTTYQLRLVLDELLTNVISYGYSDRDEHLIEVDLRLEDGVLRVRIEDDGAPFNPLHAPAPDTHCPTEDRHIGGLGIHLVTSLMDHVAYERAAEKNRLIMEKRIA